MTTASLEIERTVKITRYQCLVSAKAVQMDSRPIFTGAGGCVRG